jgi:hypothetical protein
VHADEDGSSASVHQQRHDALSRDWWIIAVKWRRKVKNGAASRNSARLFISRDDTLQNVAKAALHRPSLNFLYPLTHLFIIIGTSAPVDCR